MFNGLSTVVGNSMKLRLGLVIGKLQPDATNSQAQCRTHRTLGPAKMPVALPKLAAWGRTHPPSAPLP